MSALGSCEREPLVPWELGRDSATAETERSATGPDSRLLRPTASLLSTPQDMLPSFSGAITYPYMDTMYRGTYFHRHMVFSGTTCAVWPCARDL